MRKFIMILLVLCALCMALVMISGCTGQTTNSQSSALLTSTTAAVQTSMKPTTTIKQETGSISIDSIKYELISQKPIIFYGSGRDHVIEYTFNIDVSGKITDAPVGSWMFIVSNPMWSGDCPEPLIQVSGWTDIQNDKYALGQFRRDTNSPASTTWKSTFYCKDIYSDQFDGSGNSIMFTARFKQPDQGSVSDDKELIIPHPV